MPAGATIDDIILGTGALAGGGTVVTIHHRGFLARGASFVVPPMRIGRGACTRAGARSSRDGNTASWGCCVGGRRRLIINPPLAYRHEGVPGIVPPTPGSCVRWPDGMSKVFRRRGLLTDSPDTDTANLASTLRRPKALRHVSGLRRWQPGRRAWERRRQRSVLEAERMRSIMIRAKGVNQ
jgi:hypothetical protein